MSNQLITANGVTDLRPIIVAEDINVGQIPRRAYDFSKGDRRFFDIERAIDHANDEASRTGIRQVVRPDTEALGDTLFVVQAIGS